MLHHETLKIFPLSCNYLPTGSHCFQTGALKLKEELDVLQNSPIRLSSRCFFQMPVFSLNDILPQVPMTCR